MWQRFSFISRFNAAATHDRLWFTTYLLRGLHKHGTVWDRRHTTWFWTLPCLFRRLHPAKLTLQRFHLTGPLPAWYVHYTLVLRLYRHLQCGLRNWFRSRYRYGTDFAADRHSPRGQARCRPTTPTADTGLPPFDTGGLLPAERLFPAGAMLCQNTAPYTGLRHTPPYTPAFDSERIRAFAAAGPRLTGPAASAHPTHTTTCSYTGCPWMDSVGIYLRPTTCHAMDGSFCLRGCLCRGHLQVYHPPLRPQTPPGLMTPLPFAR